MRTADVRFRGNGGHRGNLREAELGSRQSETFKVMLQLAAPGDKIEDPSVAWASTNKITTLGMLTVASVVPDSEATERALMFLPALLPAGIEPADPMIQFRNKTYPVSYERRHQS